MKSPSGFSCIAAAFACWPWNQSSAKIRSYVPESGSRPRSEYSSRSSKRRSWSGSGCASQSKGSIASKGVGASDVEKWPRGQLKPSFDAVVVDGPAYASAAAAPAHATCVAVASPSFQQASGTTRGSASSKSPRPSFDEKNARPPPPPSKTYAAPKLDDEAVAGASPQSTVAASTA